MLTATKDVLLPTTVTGSWPRPSWFHGNLNRRPFSSAFGDAEFREQYVDAISTVLATRSSPASTSSPTATTTSTPTWPGVRGSRTRRAVLRPVGD